ncbi:class I lanthipeptide [Flammeovirga sp. OC4]|uniref:class I lanthipeptide n=1 Tax=Flammeovirga sp. OC4 TaxID=1382345 RepID=UPI0005C76E65|nr:class I lanthipeptide [Flammeovirga sp. OC4]
MKKLKLNKEVLSSLDKSEMSQVKGGFTYIVTLGSRCRQSKGYGKFWNYEQCTNAMIEATDTPMQERDYTFNGVSSPNSPTTPSIKPPSLNLK